MRRIITTPEVDALMKEAGIPSPLDVVEVASIDCIVCGKREQLDEEGPPLSVVLDKTRKHGSLMLRLQIAHAKCAPSHVRTSHPDEIEPGTGSLSVILLTRGGLAAMAFAPRSPVVSAKENGPIDLWLEHFLNLGFKNTNAPITLKELTGWHLDVTHNAINLVGVEDELHEFAIRPDDAWEEAISARPQCLVITGSIDVADFSVSRLEDALDTGRAVAALVRIVDARH